MLKVNTESKKEDKNKRPNKSLFSLKEYEGKIVNNI